MCTDHHVTIRVVTGWRMHTLLLQVSNRSEWYEEWREDLAPLRERGAEYGMQYVVYHETQVRPQFIVRYRRKRLGPSPPAHVDVQPRGRGHRTLPEESWTCLTCGSENETGILHCQAMRKQGGGEQACGAGRPL